MSSVSYRFLHGLSDDGDFIKSLDQLFQASSYSQEKGWGLALWPWLLGAAILLTGLSVAWLRFLGRG